jgi:hypothetical protein
MDQESDYWTATFGHAATDFIWKEVGGVLHVRVSSLDYRPE